MKRVASVLLTLAVFATLAGCAGNPYGPKGDFKPIRPFEPLPKGVTVYEGVGAARDANLHVGIRKAETAAMGDLARSIFRVVVSESSVYVKDPEKQRVLLDDITTVVTVLPLPGTLFKECVRKADNNEVWCRVYMAKSEVDEQIFSQLVAMSKNLLKDSEEKLRQHIQKSGSRAERDVRILREFRSRTLDS